MFANAPRFMKSVNIFFREQFPIYDTQFFCIFAQLHNYLNTKGVFRYTVNDINFLAINYHSKGISVITWINIYVFQALW